jgi:hypothetical protein
MTGSTSKSNCLYCPAFSNTNSDGLTFISSCYCKPGYTGTAGACVACVPGTYKAAISSALCITCGASKYSGVGFTTCCVSASFESCLPSQYYDGTCKSCPLDSVAPACSTSGSSCACNTGYTGPANACAACVADSRLQTRLGLERPSVTFRAG